jgi:hypothetical protein
MIIKLFKKRGKISRWNLCPPCNGLHGDDREGSLGVLVGPFGLSRSVVVEHVRIRYLKGTSLESTKEKDKE